MPNYVFKCTNCDYIGEYNIEINELKTAIHYCPTCFFKDFKSSVLVRDFNPSRDCKNQIIKSSKQKQKSGFGDDRFTDDKGVKKDFKEQMAELYDRNKEIEDDENKEAELSDEDRKIMRDYDRGKR